MRHMTDLDESDHGTPPKFHTTRWSMVVAAGNQHALGSEDALAQLCNQYWKPLYIFVRRSGYQPADAQDLTQGFFERLIEKRFLQAADVDRGRFRTFLLAALKNYMVNEWKKGTRLKRGGGLILSLNFDSVEDGLSIEPADGRTAEREFDREWAIGLLDRVLERVEASYSAKGNGLVFSVLRPYLTAGGDRLPYQQTADANAMTVGQVKVGVHRLRATYREILEQEIAVTVGSRELIPDEVRQLYAALQ
ncbi:RNA polymerase sigma factor [Fuerstiella marisgermanici]|uniref:RNA polymerase sigma factor n=1 Tax=Fuerstiella marisgermanici TaxID=1891926 RepID=A0A1P8WEV6_9PLAN|nr:sigma-70 family RNA polymerase sigma factor [Fuerstiella marisgermanici]APZ92594.1 RNA polymerase sigma factor [Fuerstiella marisgermanici]